MADQGSEGLLSPFLRNQRIHAAKPHLRGRVLDFGCGAGSLAAFVSERSYLGVDRDAVSLQQARADYPQHEFREDFAEGREHFDSVVALAVIEHVEDPSGFLRFLASFLSGSAAARVIITTPHPSMEWIHRVGSRCGVFSRHANEEHQELLDFRRLEGIAFAADLRLAKYRRFLFGANQLAIYERTVL